MVTKGSRESNAGNLASVQPLPYTALENQSKREDEDMSSRLRLNATCTLLTVFLLLSLGCRFDHSSRSDRDARSSETKTWDAHVNDFLDAYFVAHPDFAVRAGRHEFDGKLPDWSTEGISAEIKRLHAEKDSLRGYKDSALSERQRFERDYVASVVDADLFWLESAEWPYRNPQFLCRRD